MLIEYKIPTTKEYNELIEKLEEEKQKCIDTCDRVYELNAYDECIEELCRISKNHIKQSIYKEYEDYFRDILI